MDYIIIDKRMRNIEKNTLKYLGYRLVEMPKSDMVYTEVSSHVDIFASKIGDTLVVEKSNYKYFIEKLKYTEFNLVCGNEKVGLKYPEDIKYNVCIVGKNAIHNFKYTDKEIIKALENNNYELIEISQGYSNCSIAVIDDNSVIVTDKNIADRLIANNISVLYLDYTPDIKLKDEYGNYSSMLGFIGGTIGKVDNNIVIFGDLNKIDKDNKIRNFITDRKLNIIDFKDLDVIDYGGIIEL